jgi:hypothetical protein
MSSTLTYRTVPTGKSLPDELKYAIKNLDEFNQTINNMTVDETLIPTLRGMEAGGVKGAKTLISAIKKYGEIILDEEY